MHAADPDHALLNARNVFVRRPSAVDLWVAPVSAIFSMTQEELEKNPAWYVAEDAADNSLQPYEIFCKTTHRRSMVFMDHMGQLEARSPQEGLLKAIEKFNEKPALAWWIIPSSAMVRTEPDVAKDWFDSARTKTYKQQSQYGFVKPTLQGKHGRGGKQNG